jgi:hypothetical protein
MVTLAARAKPPGHHIPPREVAGLLTMRKKQENRTGDGNKYACVHCGAAREDEAHALLRYPRYSAARQQMLGTIGWPRNETDLVDQDAVRWMVPDASLARCSDLEFFEAVQKFCQEIAGTKNCRK